MKSDKIVSAVKAVTKSYCKQRKAEERGSRRPREYYYSDRVNFSDIADEILPEAYQHASGGGMYTVSKRQLYYASRERFNELTDRELDYSYFAQTIVVQYLNRRPDLNWKITADPRGTFTIPNAAHEIRIPVGTIQIDVYLDERAEVDDLSFDHYSNKWQSQAEQQRYAAVMYIEKEGFEPLLKEARIAERFDLAILSCKGQSVVAARKLVDHVCAVNGGVPLFVVHDFDKAGFEIAERLTTESDWAQDLDRVAYKFQNKINVVDFGLRLDDVEKYQLQSERCKFNGHLPSSFTREEREFLSSGNRVELNAFTAPQFIEWLESKLKQHLPERFLPDDDILERAYRRAAIVKEINAEIDRIRDEKKEITIPENLRQKVNARMKQENCPWDVAVSLVVEQ